MRKSLLFFLFLSLLLVACTPRTTTINPETQIITEYVFVARNVTEHKTPSQTIDAAIEIYTQSERLKKEITKSVNAGAFK